MKQNIFISGIFLSILISWIPARIIKDKINHCLFFIITIDFMTKLYIFSKKKFVYLDWVVLIKNNCKN